MDVTIIFKIAAVGILVAVLNQVLIRAGREEQAMLTTLAGLVVVLFWVIQYIKNLFMTALTPMISYYTYRLLSCNTIIAKYCFGEI